MREQSQLVRRAAEGDAAAFGRLVESHWSRLVRVARSVVGELEAEDAVQDGLIRAWRRLPQLDEPDAFGAWLYRVVVRVCLRRVRSRKPLEISSDGVGMARVNPQPGAGIDVARLLSKLPRRQRAVMHLTVVEGMTDGEIGPILGITAGSVRAHRRRARERLRRFLSTRSTA